MFQGLVFHFPFPTVSLSKNRIETLIRLASVQGAEVISRFQPEAYIIVGADAHLSLCQSVIPNFAQLKQRFIKAEWLSQSLQHRKLLNVDEFRLFPVEKEPKELIPTQQMVFSDNLGKAIPVSLTSPEKDEEELQLQQKSLLLISRESSAHLSKFAKEMMREYRQMLDYNYDSIFENFHDQIDYLEESFEGVKMESDLKLEADLINGGVPTFTGDEECMITEVRKAESTLFEGIEIKQPINLEQPICSAPLKITQQFQPGLKRKAQFWEPKKGYFVCEAGDAHTSFNNQIIAELEKLLKIYTNDKDKGRCIAYRKAIGFIKSLKFPIRSEEDVTDMPTIGDKIKRKIVEIIQTGKLTKVEKLQGLERNVVVGELSRVWGIGPTTALSLYFKGYRSISDLRANSHILNRQQLIGLKYVEEFEQRIPRDEVGQIFEIVKREIEGLSDVQDVYEAIPCGSYRRGKETCGDIDVLITRKDGKDATGFLGCLVQRLEGILLTDHLQVPKLGSHGSESYMGVGQLNPQSLHRRIDFKYYPREQYGCAVLYFTGSDHYNRSMRLFAQKRGYSLSDHGVYPTLRGQHNKKVWKGELIPCTTEMDVYKLLGLTYRKPEDRSV